MHMQRINVRVTPRARVQKIIADESGNVHVYTNAAPTDGDANAAVIKMLARYFDVPKGQIKIIRGHTSRDKVIEF